MTKCSLCGNKKCKRKIKNCKRFTPKRWREYSSKDVYKIKNEQCKYCIYSKGVGRGTFINNITCEYILDVGHSRGCSPAACDKFKPKVG